MFLLKIWKIIAVAFSFTLFGICGFIIGAVLFPIVSFFFPKQTAQRINVFLNHSSWSILIFILRMLLIISVDTKQIKQYKNIKGTIIVANHPTLIDIVLLMGYFSNGFCIVKGSLVHNFFMRPIIRKIHIVNDVEPEILLDHCEKALHHNYNFFIFPTGTRQIPGIKLKLSRSSAQIALHSKVNILPIHIECQNPILCKNQKWYDIPSKLTKFTFSSPGIINYSSLDLNKSNHQLAIELTNLIEQKIF